jgi:Peptidase family M1 domain
MKITPFLFSLTLLLHVNKGLTQKILPVPLNIAHAINNSSRTNEGIPGSAYWQNSGAYSIQVSLDPASRLVTGTEQIVYTNNSPDSLARLDFKLYPNIFQKGAIRVMRVNPQDLNDGVTITNFKIDQVSHPVPAITKGTDMIVPVPTILPQHTVQVSLDFSYTLNTGPDFRTGAVDSAAFFVAYFFPRISVYDDIDGWNRNPYIGSQEFYNDFCHFSVAVTVPGDYLVWATGDLKNKEEVLDQKYINRISEAEKSNDIKTIVDSSDLATGHITRPHAFNTWKFEASNVTDFVFATSNHYLWDASSVEVDPSAKRRTRVDAVYNPRHTSYSEVIQFARKTVELMSYRFPKWPFPYQHETVFDGLDQMEYPMMVNDNPVEDVTETIALTNHEIFHTMFPFYMGINETKYGWMDEGWATIGEWLLSPMIDTAFRDNYGIEAYNQAAGKEIDLPITTLSTQIADYAYFLNCYPKPALGYLYVKDMLGENLFFKGLHEYFRNWNGKHPDPLDFFYSMNRGSGKNMNWFWKRWFYDDGYPDLAIGAVNKVGKEWLVTIESPGTKPVPVDLTIFYTDGSTQKIHRDISCWEKGNRSIQLRFPETKKPMKMTLGSLYVPDINKKNNEYAW